VSCGGGTRTRTVECVRIPGRETVDDSFCAALTRPSEEVECNRIRCSDDTVVIGLTVPMDDTVLDDPDQLDVALQEMAVDVAEAADVSNDRVSVVGVEEEATDTSRRLSRHLARVRTRVKFAVEEPSSGADTVSAEMAARRVVDQVRDSSSRLRTSSRRLTEVDESSYAVAVVSTTTSDVSATEVVIVEPPTDDDGDDGGLSTAVVRDRSGGHVSCGGAPNRDGR